MNDRQSGFVEVPGGRLYFEADGAGSAVTLIHAGVANLRMWDGQVAAWRDRHHVVRYDTRGFGRTLTEDVPYSNRDDLRRLLNHLGIERTHLVGLSRGAMIALDFSLEQPARVLSLAWIAGGIGGFEGPPDGVDWDEVERLWRERRFDELVERETQIWTDGLGQPPTRVEPEVRRRMIEWNMANYSAGQVAEQAQPLDPPVAGRLAELAVPTLVAWGDLDVPSTPAAGERLAGAVRGARRYLFEGVAHMVNLERPAQFNRLVGDFIDDVDAGADG
ncbi:MAG TPA: alpha/beta fold hydrolase [Candidatus Limnocylindria bacterium]|nr:alpha/beta fold hydrolase [Candidatus Limnocylindria bacterium]